VRNKAHSMGIPLEDKILYTVVNTIMVLWLIIVILPVWFVIVSSFSSNFAIETGRVLLWPVGFQTSAYYVVFHYKLVWTAYANTLFYTVCQVAYSLTGTILAAYPLSRRNLQFRGFYIGLFLVTMFISGGMVPTYINMRNLGLLNTRASQIIPGLVGTSNMIILRTFFMNSIPADLQEIIMTEIDKVVDAQIEGVKEADAASKKILEEKGVVINKVAPEERAKMIEAEQPLYDQYANEYGVGDLIVKLQELGA